MTRTALVLETNNLRGDAANAAVVTLGLGRLLERLAPCLVRVDEVVVTHDGLSASQQEALAQIAGRGLRFVGIGPETDYYEAKNRGFDATTAAVVAFGDADCWPDPAWLAELLAPFADPAVQVVAGRTTYRSDTLGAALTAVDFLYFPSPAGPDHTRNFYANNVAFRREVFAARRFPPKDTVYRGHCQMLGMSLVRDGVPIRFVVSAHTVHRFPDSRSELLRLRWLRGSDAAELTPAIATSALPHGLAWLGRAGPLSVTAVLGARLVFGIGALGRQGIPVGGLSRVGGLGALAGVTALDWLGALGGRGSVDEVLSYHRNGDELEA